MGKTVTIAIDGPAGAGKSTLARRLAERLGYLYIDTGAMYRAIALWAKRLGVSWDDAPRLEQLARESRIELASGGRVILNGEDVSEAIRDPDISEGASRVSAIPGVRRALVAKQQQMGREASVVMEGRDIGTVVFPQAEVKIFLDATPEERARRRLKDLAARGIEADFAAVLAEMKRRDERDSTRADSPLRQAPDAIYVDSTGMSEDEVEQALLKIVRERTSNGKEVTN
ncbi:MAG: cytidylate kinase [Bryobacteraceae bacterium]|nr:MAG: cytidylate kinase [Bryobacteraceae bacterium]